jgi:hypothetical protein
MASEGIERAHPAEQAGVLLGRAYAAAVSTLVAPVRRPATPTWHWRAAHRAGSALRAAAGCGADVLERRARTAPQRLVDGVKRLFRTVWGGSWRALGSRAGGTVFVGWWVWAWAASAGVSPRVACWAALATCTVVAYTAGREPAERPVTRRQRAAQHAAVRNLLSAIHHMLRDVHGLHLADLADQITGRSQALGTPVNCTVGSLRALLEPLGVPIRSQLTIGDLNRPGIHAGDWRVWAARHGAPLTPTTVTGPPPRVEETTTPMRDQPLPRAETAIETIPLGVPKLQVNAGGLEISAQDLGPAATPGEGRPRTRSTADERLIAHARHAIGQARGAHLRSILAVAQAAGDCRDWSVTRLRRELDQLSIAVEEKLWLNGGNTRGVLATSLPEPAHHDEEAV